MCIRDRTSGVRFRLRFFVLALVNPSQAETRATKITCADAPCLDSIHDP